MGKATGQPGEFPLSEEEEQERYTEIMDTFGAEFRSVTNEKLRDVVDSSLVIMGDPRSYASTLAFSKATLEAVVLWLVTEGWLVLADKALATEDEIKKRRERRAEREVGVDALDHLAHTGVIRAADLSGNGYL